MHRSSNKRQSTRRDFRPRFSYWISKSSIFPVFNGFSSNFSIFHRLTRAYIAPRFDHRIAETEAGRRFLETLRRNHENGGDDAFTDEGMANQFEDFKHRRMALRASLEELIVEYLRGLTSDQDERRETRQKCEQDDAS